VEDRTGLIVPKDDIDALTAALQQLTDPARRGELGRAGRRHAATHFTVARMADAYRAVYDELLAQPRRHRVRPTPEKA
ncbi:MAG TPA: hypothetical protein VLR26_14740, partial [Frankiaceae bacterium]|nr:hypothetical protein [Frankiaceae bacterium]